MHHLAAVLRGAPAFLLADRLAGQFDPVSIVHQTVQNAVGHRGITDLRMPLLHGQLAGQDRGASVIAVIADLQEIAAFLLVQRCHGKIIHHQHIDAGDSFQCAAQASIRTRDHQLTE
jgi:hypothetical protein